MLLESSALVPSSPQGAKWNNSLLPQGRSYVPCPTSHLILLTQPSSVSRVSLGLRAPVDFLAPKDLR